MADLSPPRRTLSRFTTSLLIILGYGVFMGVVASWTGTMLPAGWASPVVFGFNGVGCVLIVIVLARIIRTRK